jgi:hypothetical protein
VRDGQLYYDGDNPPEPIETFPGKGSASTPGAAYAGGFITFRRPTIRSISQGGSPVRGRTLVKVALLSGGLAACSKPSPDSAKQTRDLQLLQPAGAEVTRISSLEAEAPPTHGQLAGPKTAVISAPAAKAQRAKALAEALRPVDRPQSAAVTIASPELTPTLRTAAAAPAPAQLAAAPEPAPDTAVFRIARGLRDGGYRESPSDDYRGPGVIIRGAPGGIDDKCDPHHRGPGAAVHRMAPSLTAFTPRGIR